MKTAELKPASLAAHSPTPWIKQTADNGRIDILDSASEGVVIATVAAPLRRFGVHAGDDADLKQANAEHIVHCVNAHASLTAQRDAYKAALENASFALDIIADADKANRAKLAKIGMRPERFTGPGFAEVNAAKARAALALASTEGGK